MKYLFLISALTAFAANAQNFSPSAGAGVPSSTAPQGAGTTLQGASPATMGAGNFSSPSSSINTGVTPANTNTTLGDGRTANPNLNQPSTVPGLIPNDTTQLNTPSNNPIQQSQEDPLNFSTLPSTTTSPSSTPGVLGTDPAGTNSSDTDTNTNSPIETFPSATP